MGRIIAVANQKGGVGKTTTAINLSSCLAAKGQKVLAIDMDPQGNMTSGLSVEKDDVEYTVYDLLIGEANIEQIICKNVFENLDVLPTNIDLSGAEIELLDVDNKQFILKEKVEEVRDNYDFVIIDCPPSLSLLTINISVNCSNGIPCCLSASSMTLALLSICWVILSNVSSLIYSMISPG